MKKLKGKQTTWEATVHNNIKMERSFKVSAVDCSAPGREGLPEWWKTVLVLKIILKLGEILLELSGDGMNFSRDNNSMQSLSRNNQPYWGR